MRYKLLGHSGLRVSEICLGTMTFGEEWGWGGSYEESRKMFDCFAEAGGNFIDTANLYTNGTSEKYVGDFIKGDREKWVVATKYSLNTKNGEINGFGNHRKNMVQAVEASLKRLQVEYIDLLWLHAWDFTTPIEEVMRAFDDLVRAGKILYIGISDTPAWIVSSANTIAHFRGWTQFVGLQIEYSLKERTPERDLLPMAKALDIGVTAWSPLAGGLLTGKYNSSETATETKRLDSTAAGKISERDLKIAGEVSAIAAEIGKPASQVALNWLRQQSVEIIPIVGSRKLSQLQENLACLDFQLTPEQMGRLDAVSAIELGFPHEFLKSSMVQDFAFGGGITKIDNHRL
ncbi:aldo/keto reductase [filamentous cyanobacterium Phorm 6]|nr:aldo/keto reductase [filamentous cyanobacterium Phorm 6]